MRISEQKVRSRQKNPCRSRNLARTSQAHQSARDAGMRRPARSGGLARPRARNCFAAWRTEIERAFPIPRSIIRKTHIKEKLQPPIPIDMENHRTTNKITTTTTWRHRTHRTWAGWRREHRAGARRRPRATDGASKPAEIASPRLLYPSAFRPTRGSVGGGGLYGNGMNGEVEAVMVANSCEPA
jgi:hypothetical protein